MKGNKSVDCLNNHDIRYEGKQFLLHVRLKVYGTADNKTIYNLRVKKN